jgi:HEAT repeat-containing protein 5
MYSPGERTMTVSEAEVIITLCTKSLEGADQVTRRSLARLVGHLLAITQTTFATSDISSKGRKDEGAKDDGIVSAAYASSEPKTLLTPLEMFAQLSAQFNKPNATRKTRIGIFDFYFALLNQLGAAFVEANYSLIVGHLMAEIVSNPRNSATRYETLLVRHLVCILLRDVMGVRMLSEQGQLAAIQELSKSYLKRWPAMMPGQVAPSSPVLGIALKEVASLLPQLGNAPPPVQVCHCHVFVFFRLII